MNFTRTTSLQATLKSSCFKVCLARKAALLFPIAFFSTKASSPSYFTLFPQTFPKGGPPESSFVVNNRSLKKEYRKLQAANHPDLINNLNKSESDDKTKHLSSSLINAAYSTLNDPLKRSQYLLKTRAGIDLTSDAAAHKYEFADREILMQILDIHESLENMKNEEEAEKARDENKTRMKGSIDKLTALYEKKPINYDEIALETIKLKYWYNIKNALKQWQPGQPVNLTH